MSAYTGASLNVQWIYSGGTVVLTTNAKYRSFNPGQSVDLHDQTAGAETDKTYIAGVKDGNFSFAGLMLDSAVGGTAFSGAFIPGNSGTLIWSPEGTASGKSKYTAPAIVQNYSTNNQYAALTEVSISWQRNGATTPSSN